MPRTHIRRLRIRVTRRWVSLGNCTAGAQGKVVDKPSSRKRYMTVFIIVGALFGSSVLYFNDDQAVVEASTVAVGPIGMPLVLQSSGSTFGPIGESVSELSEAPKIKSALTKPQGLKRAVLTNGVVQREPIDEINGVVPLAKNGVKRVYFYTEFQNMKGRTVSHLWEHGGKILARVPFEIRGNRWRVYSIKRLTSNLVGDWQIYVSDEQGKILLQDSFVYGE